MSKLLARQWARDLFLGLALLLAALALVIWPQETMAEIKQGRGPLGGPRPDAQSRRSSSSVSWMTF